MEVVEIILDGTSGTNFRNNIVTIWLQFGRTRVKLCDIKGYMIQDAEFVSVYTHKAIENYAIKN